MTLAIFLSSWLVLTYNNFVFTYWGIVSASLWVFASVLSIFAINNVGLATAQGLWSGATIFVSFLWGTLVFHQTPDSIPLAIVALVLLAIGIAGMSIAGSNLLVKAQANDDVPTQEMDPLVNETDTAEPPAQITWLGIACALGLSLTNGSMLAPYSYAPDEAKPSFLVSFGIGVLIVTPVFAVIYFVVFRKKPDFNLVKVVALPGMLCGLGWNIGNWASIYATMFLGYTVGFPLSQCALLVGGFWGIVLFKEITGIKRVSLFFISSLILLGGAVLLGVYGGKPQ